MSLQPTKDYDSISFLASFRIRDAFLTWSGKSCRILFHCGWLGINSLRKLTSSGEPWPLEATTVSTMVWTAWTKTLKLKRKSLKKGLLIYKRCIFYSGILCTFQSPESMSEFAVSPTQQHCVRNCPLGFHIQTLGRVTEPQLYTPPTAFVKESLSKQK